MKARLLLGLCALLAFPGCFDPIVGSQCAKGYSRCGGKCVVAGTCALPDAGDDALDLEAGITDVPADRPDTAKIETLGSDATDDSESLTDAENNRAEAGALTDASGLLDDAAPPEVDDAGLEPTDGDVEDTAGTPEEDAPLGGPGDTGFPASAVDAPVPLPDSSPDNRPAPDLGAFTDTSDDSDDDGLACPDCDGGVDTPGGLALDASDTDGEDGRFGLGDADGGDAENDAVDAEAGPLVCAPGLSVCGEQCVDLINDSSNCGTCGTTCATGVCSEGSCLECPDTAPTWCGSQCTNTASDPDNCGSCGAPCDTGLCSNSNCEAAGTGRVIVIGHDYTDYSPARIVKNRVVGNAVFLWPHNPVRLLHYVGDATAVSIQNVDKAINQVAGSRTILRSYAYAADVPLWLPYVDVFLIYAQAHAGNTTLTQLGANWASALADFVQNRGGTIIVLDADQTDNAGTVQILASAGLLNVTRQASASAPGLICYVTARGDALATGLTRTYSCQANSTTFNLGESGTAITSVVETILGDAASAPVVISKIF